MAEPPLPPPTQSPTLTTPPCLDNQLHDPGLEFNNIAVIIAAMLCALLCALGLNSTLHCVFRCTQQALTEPAQWAASRRLNSGLKKKDMVALPTSTYVMSSSSPPTSAASVSSSCAICLGDFCEGDEIRVLPQCEHRFHVDCIDEWLLSHSSCPTCRHQLKSNHCVPCLEIVTAS